MALSAYGSEILTYGDVSVRDTMTSSQLRVDVSESVNSRYVYEGGEVPESLEICREVYTYDADSVCGKYSTACVTKGEGYTTMEVGMETAAEETRFLVGDREAVLSKGLSFNSDESAIYFGHLKTFRIMFEDDDPARLVFQYFDSSTSQYVTKFSCTKL